MMIDDCTAGLLSRFGPSLMSPGAMIDETTFCSFSTNTFLDGFAPNPATGVVLVSSLNPGRKAYPYSGKMNVVPLVDDAVDGFERSVSGILQDASQISASQDRWGLIAPHSLVSTDRQWQILHSSFGDERASSVELLSNSGKYRRFYRQANGTAGLAVGWHGEQAQLEQEALVNGEGRVATVGYSFEFFNGAMDSLRTYLGMERAKGYEVAAEIGLRIYASSQYYSGEGDRPTLAMNVPEVNGRDFHASLGQENAPAIAQIHWQDDKEGGHLVVHLRRALPTTDIGLMPLDPSLRELLWDGAMHLL